MPAAPALLHPAAYYNEYDPGAAEWLRALIAAGEIAPGEVDTRSIEDVSPDDLSGFTQCHFFAGIGVWSHALRRAGWPDDRPVWTGSCPCQPFSAAGKGKGTADERHLWPAFFHLIAACRPAAVLGEQVASKDGLGWFDLVSADLEGTDYAIGAADLCAAGVGVDWDESQGGEWLRRAIHDCPDPVVAGALRDFADWAGGNLGAGGWHIRQRLYWCATDLRAVGDADDARLEGWREPGCERAAQWPAGPGSVAGGLADADNQGQGGRGVFGPGKGDGTGDGVTRQRPAGFCTDGGLSDLPCGGWGEERPHRGGRAGGDRAQGRPAGSGDGGGDLWADPGHGGRGRADWLLCRDAKWRPVEPGTFPLAHEAAARVGRLRGYGNALDAETATAFIAATMGALAEASA